MRDRFRLAGGGVPVEKHQLGLGWQGRVPGETGLGWQGGSTC